MNAQRVNEIIKSAQAHICWPDSLERYMEEDEISLVGQRWKTMPGNTCWLDALISFRRTNP